jgi:RHS repeat-associated protein
MQKHRGSAATESRTWCCSFIYGPNSLPIGQINNSTGTVTYLHHDQQGSTRLLTGSTGKTEGSYSYSPYGTPERSGTATTPLGYDGQYTNSDTGLIYLRAREYDPTTAQFLSVDPLGAVTRAPYTYADSNPVNDSDPTGLCSINPFSSASCATEGLEAVAHYAENHYGQIAETGALAVCVATEVGALPCLGATGAGFIASTVQNAASSSGFSPAAEGLDVLGALPGVQVAGADVAGLLGDGVGQTAAKWLSTIVGGGAIAGESPMSQASGAPCG